MPIRGHVLGCAVRADLTVTFIGRKLGCYLGAGPDHAGTIVFDDLEVPLGAYDGIDTHVEAARRVSRRRLRCPCADARRTRGVTATCS